MNGGRFDFDDGGTYCGGWEEGKAHGHGVCTGPKGQGEYSGAWHYGFEVSGIYTWPSGNTYEGQWQNGKRHGLGVEKRGRWKYRGEWTQGYKGRYGMRQSSNSQAKYEGTWSSGLQDGYGTETYADGGIYQGQWLRGMRHGYGIRKSAAYGVAAKYRSRSHAHASLTSLRSEQGDDQGGAAPLPEKDKKGGGGGDDSRGGFVLRARSEPPSRRRSLSERSIAVKRTILQGLRIKKQRSTGDIHTRVTQGTGSIRSSGSTASCTSDESAYTGYSGGHHHEHHSNLGPEEFVDPQATETYMGEWKNDKRSGFGVSERSDGLKYEGEWFNNKKFGYGVTTLKDATKEEGKYKNNILVTSQRKKHLLFVRSSKLRERIDEAVAAANRAAQIALQKADIAISRTATAKDRAEQADYSALQAGEDSDIARLHAKQFDPNFHQPGTEVLKKQRAEQGNHVPYVSPPSRTAGQNNPHRSASLFNPKREDPLDYGEARNPENELTPPMVTPPSEPLKENDFHSSEMQSLRPSPSQMGNNPSAVHHQMDNPYREKGNHLPPVPTSLPVTSNYGQRPDINEEAIFRAPEPRTTLASGQGVAFLDSEYPASSTSVSQAPSQNSSRFSLNQIMNDHFDQYTMAANPAAAKLYQQNLLRQHQQSPDVRVSDSSSEIVPPGGIVRRSTLASARDWKKLAAPYDLTNPPLGVKEDFLGPSTSGLVQRRVFEAEADEGRGSLPHLAELESNPVSMTRDVVSRMSSQRRQELQRMQEEADLLRSNPLRYIFHPAVRAWLVRWKLPLLVLLVNLCLSIIFYQLLTYHKRDDLEESDDS